MNGFRLIAVVVVSPKKFSLSFTKTTQKFMSAMNFFFPSGWRRLFLRWSKPSLALSAFWMVQLFAIARCDFGLCASLCVECTRVCLHVYKTAVDRSLHIAKPNLIPIQKCICENACVLQELYAIRLICGSRSYVYIIIHVSVYIDICMSRTDAMISMLIPVFLNTKFFRQYHSNDG